MSDSERQNISSGSPYEPTFGFSRAVKVGRQIFVSGCTAIQADGTIAGGGDPYAQAKAALATIETALAEAGASLADVVRTRVFVTSAEYYGAIEQAHGELFGAIRPASTFVVVSGLVRPEMLVEIEVDAVL